MIICVRIRVNNVGMSMAVMARLSSRYCPWSMLLFTPQALPCALHFQQTAAKDQRSRTEERPGWRPCTDLRTSLSLNAILVMP